MQRLVLILSVMDTRSVFFPPPSHCYLVEEMFSLSMNSPMFYRGMLHLVWTLINHTQQNKEVQQLTTRSMSEMKNIMYHLAGTYDRI